ncbi:hypothetical protein MMC30_007087 [Trapelia coarctata]|nr:hypothetical protein [Trapelia coarctata]
MGKSVVNEFPMLGNLGLYAAPTTGNGNCLFISFSDQLYGNEDHHLEIRARVVEYLAEHADYFKPFTAVNLGGGERRNSRRKVASKYATTFDFYQATENDVDLQYSLKLQRMAELGTYGDHMEIMAFSAAYGVDVNVYRAPGVAEIVTPDCLVGVTSAERPVAHIAYHDHEHYSSVRPLHTIHTGLLSGPRIHETIQSPEPESFSSSQGTSSSGYTSASDDSNIVAPAPSAKARLSLTTANGKPRHQWPHSTHINRAKVRKVSLKAPKKKTQIRLIMSAQRAMKTPSPVTTPTTLDLEELAI